MPQSRRKNPNNYERRPGNDTKRRETAKYFRAVIDDGSCGFEQKYICFKFVIHLCQGERGKCLPDGTYRVSSVELAPRKAPSITSDTHLANQRITKPTLKLGIENQRGIINKVVYYIQEFMNTIDNCCRLPFFSFLRFSIYHFFSQLESN